MAPDIVGLGMSCLDLLIRTRDLPTWESGARLSAMGIEGGGPVATALAAASRLGASTSFIGTYGSDRMGAIKIQTLLDYQVDVSHAVCRPGPENQAILVYVHADTGERVFSGGGGYQTATLQPDEIDPAFITSARCLHLDGYHSAAALAAAGWMRAAGKPVMLDASATRGPVSDEMRRLVEMVDVLICGSGFGPALTGWTDLWQAGEAMLKMGPRVVVQTEGADGSYAVTPEERFHIPAFQVPVIDTTGAGDVFHGAYLVGMLRGWDARSTCLFSTAVAAIKCSRLGGRAGIPTFAETLAFLRERGVQILESMYN